MPPNNDELMPYKVIDKSAMKFWLVDSRGDAELGNWFIAEFRFKEHAQHYCDHLNTRAPIPAPTPSAEAVRVAVEALKLMQQAMSILNEKRGSSDPFIKTWCNDGSPVVAKALSALRALPADQPDEDVFHDPLCKKCGFPTIGGGHCRDEDAAKALEE